MSPSAEVLFVIAWPIWAGGYPEQGPALSTILRRIPALRRQAEDRLNKLGSEAGILDIRAAVGGYQPISGLSPSQYPANSIKVTILLSMSSSDLGVNHRDRTLKLSAEFCALLTEFCRREMPGASEGANLYAVESYIQQTIPVSASPIVADSPANMNIREVILLIHGIRTAAAWAEMVARELRAEPRRKVFPVRYGYLDAIRFWLPVGSRNPFVNRVLREIRAVREAERDSQVSVVAHSFGTFALSRILISDPVRLHNVILCGAIVPTSFRWDLIRPRITGALVNDCGSRDMWPILAASATWGYGASGTFGTGSTDVRDRFHDLRHSDFFTKKFVRTYWLPIFERNEIVDSEWEASRPTPPYWHSVVLMLPIRWFLLGVLVLGVFLMSRSLLNS